MTRYKPVAKMSDEALQAEYQTMDLRYFSVRRRYVEAEMRRRGLLGEEGMAGSESLPAIERREDTKLSMSKKQLREWPWNNRPSKRHVWKVKSQNVDYCERCQSSYIRSLGGTGPVYCYARPEWLAAHPDDDGKVG
jgi:hypothetical protein